MKTIIINIYLLVCACIGLVYGLTAMYKKKQSMYFKLMVFPIACQFFSRAFYTSSLLCYSELPDIFNIGFLGFDDKKKEFLEYKLISLIIPAIELAVSIVALLLKYVSISARISFVVLSVLAGLAGYVNMKHMLIPDVENGIVKSLRRFNFLCIILEILTLAEIGFFCFSLESPIVIQVLLGIIYIFFLPFLNREVKKWIQ